jgi:glycine cleavage system aminomethyltransferase T
MIGGLNPTPFHARTAAQNFNNAWATKGAFTVPAFYVDPVPEALAARLTAALIDITPRQDLRIEGEGASELLSAACGGIVAGLPIGHSSPVHWCADGGGLRGSGTLSRMGDHDFLLRSDDADFAWFAAAAPRFGARLRDATSERGLVLLAGPYAIPVMVAARLEVPLLELNRHVTLDWFGITVTVFHSAWPLGYEIACAPEDGALLLDRLFRRGSLFGLRLAGEEALQVLQLEAGMLAPHADYAPARQPFARIPVPAAFGLKDENAPARQASAVLAGIELDGVEPLPFAPVFSNAGNKIGSTLRSLYSPALRSAIALAELSRAQAAVGTIVKVLRFDAAGPRERLGRIVPLPFL